MKKMILALTILISFSVLSQNVAFERDYLSCWPDPHERGFGYEVLIKKLQDGSVKGILFKESSFFKKASYSEVFDLDYIITENKMEQFINKEHGVNFTVYVDSFSGSTVAQIRNGLEILCTPYHEDEVRLWELDHYSAKNVDKTNLIILLNTK